MTQDWTDNSFELGHVGQTDLAAMENNFMPPTINLNEADPECDLDYIPNVGRDKEVNYTLSNSFAFGGLNAVLAFGPDPS